MRKMTSHGTADQMLAAFEQTIRTIEGEMDDVESSTQVASASNISLDTEDPYIQELIDNVNDELDDLDVYDGWNWDSDIVKNTISLILTSGQAVHEYTIPVADLKEDMDTDIEYIMKAVTAEDAEATIESSTNTKANKQVSIPDYASEEVYEDVGGGFGEPGETYSLEDLMIIWNSSCNSDPSMMEYTSFEDWWKDTRENFMKEVGSCSAIQGAKSLDTDVYAMVDEDGNSVALFHAGSLDDANLQVADYNNQNMSDYSAEYSDAVDTNGLEVLSSLDADSEYEEIASKHVKDSDDFYTDYTMYLNTRTNEYVCVFGDKEMYRPEDGDFDFECETEDEAWEWFNSYNGIGSDSDADIYSSTELRDESNPEVASWIELLGLNEEDADSFIHDLNNLRGDEWIEVAEESVDAKTLQEFKKFLKNSTEEDIYSSTNSTSGYYYITKHGIGPGMLPKDVEVSNITDLDHNLTSFYLNRFLSTKELDEYDIYPETDAIYKKYPAETS